MSDDASQGEKGAERRVTPRRSGSASALIIRESDTMRFGIKGELKDISATGLGLIMETALNPQEQIKIQLTNVIQRVEKEVRGAVRHSTLQEDGTYRVGIELSSRLTPLEVSLLAMGVPTDSQDGEKTWV